jgi:hypothetical protein
MIRQSTLKTALQAMPTTELQQFHSRYGTEAVAQELQQRRQNLECQTAMSDLVLQAARQAMPADPASQFADPTVITRLPLKHRPLVPLAMALLDALEAVVKAIDDNAWDSSAPLPRALADGLAAQSYRLGGVISNAASAPPSTGYGMPSMTGKELV